MLCSRCGAEITSDAAYCSHCGVPVGDSAHPDSMQHRRAAAMLALESGSDPAGMHCPGCDANRMRAVRIDADFNLISGFVALVVGVAVLLLVLVFGDLGLYVADASSVAIVLVMVGVALLLVARYRRRPRAFECVACGYRVP